MHLSANIGMSRTHFHPHSRGLGFCLGALASSDAIVREGITLKGRGPTQGIGSALFFDPRASQALTNPRNAGERKDSLVWLTYSRA